MHIRMEPLSGERDTLEHKQARLQEILSAGIVSHDMQANLLEALGEVQRRIGQITGLAAPQVHSTGEPHRRAA